MRILLVNDDGYDAPGIQAMHRALMPRHDCIVIAPESNRSAASHSLSIHSDLRYRAAEHGFRVSGTPSDCVKLGVLYLCEQTPDLVISGINDGPNLGSDIMYSGTVSAALEAAYLGVKGIAVSLSRHNPDPSYFRTAATLIRDKLDELVSLPIPPTTALNINYPVGRPYAGICFTKAGINTYDDVYEAVDKDGTVRLGGIPMGHKDNPSDCDIERIKEGYATVTPLTLDPNDYAALQILQGIPLK